MSTRPITILSLLQFGALFYGILATSALCRAVDRIYGSQYADSGQPAAYASACRFRDYGLWLAALIVIWAAISAYSSVRPTPLPYFDRIMFPAGIALLALLAIAGTYFAILATTPFWTF